MKTATSTNRSLARWVVGPLGMAALSAALMIAAAPAYATDWHLNADGTGDAPSIQAAFDLAAPGDVIILSPGTYHDSHTRTVLDWFLDPATTTSIAFMTPGVSIVGSGGAGVTILDGEDTHHCLVGTDLGAVSIRGITFFEGHVTGTNGLVGLGGAGAIVFRSALTVEGCVFRRCHAPYLEVEGASGLYVIQGAGAVVRSTLFVDNVAGDIGGSVGILQHSGALVENCTFVRNIANDSGGAIEINQSVVTLRNNIFALNTAAHVGGGVQCLNGAVITASCNLFWQNTAPSGPHVGASCGSIIGQSNNIVADPLFCDAAHDDFTIQPNSPAAPSDPSGCGLRGVYPATCGAVAVEPMTWGRMKALYLGK